MVPALTTPVKKVSIRAASKLSLQLDELKIYLWSYWKDNCFNVKQVSIRAASKLSLQLDELKIYLWSYWKDNCFNVLMKMFHHSLHSKYNSRKQYLSKNRFIAKNGIFFKNVFNRKYIKFNINTMSKIVFCKY